MQPKPPVSSAISYELSAPLQELREKILAGERAALAQAITLSESSRADHRRQAENLIQSLLSHTGQSIRIGISGPPGTGKSTFINRFGLEILQQGHRLAVLAVDPSSQRDSGAILADKTRMLELSQHPSSFIRPSPSGKNLGGVARYTQEAILLCEAAGYDVVMVETVGVGQSETMVAEMTDLFLLLLPPGGGDELQGMKRGILELADIILVNKADGNLLPFAEQTADEFLRAINLFYPRYADWKTDVALCSAMTGKGLNEVWQKIQQFVGVMKKAGGWQQRRSRQREYWLEKELQEQLLAIFQQEPSFSGLVKQIHQQVGEGGVLPSLAARQTIAAVLPPLLTTKKLPK
ncbi:MAG: methylmalonyl Co-A mutase-associated GTPase MeaB [Rhodospirillaceae bacterium]|nr:methylmalonyl Co-A mutase-associated GTPase MeaB [Rhodospirillaceae bacterium]